MNKEMKKKLKKVFNLYNMAVFGCISIIVISMILITNPKISLNFSKESASVSQKEEIFDKSNNKLSDEKQDDVKIVNNNVGKNISEDDAKELAKKQFKELNEKALDTDKFQLLKIQRDGEEYYYICSPENTMEIKVSTGEITRVNSIKIEK